MGPVAELLLVTGLVAAWFPWPGLIGCLRFLLEFLIGSVRWFASMTPEVWMARPSGLETLALVLLLVGAGLACRGRASAALAAGLLGGVVLWLNPSLPQEVFIRSVDLGCKVIWVRHPRGDALILEEDWVEGRALAMLRQLGGQAPGKVPPSLRGSALKGWYLESEGAWFDLRELPPRRQLVRHRGRWLVTEW